MNNVSPIQNTDPINKIHVTLNTSQCLCYAEHTNTKRGEGEIHVS